MKRALASLDASRLDGQRALVRVDFNVPVKDGVVTDDTRIRAALPTLRFLREKGARVVLLSHFGRPKDGPDPRYSLRQLVRPLEALLGAPVGFIEDPSTPVAAAFTRRMPRGSVALAENREMVFRFDVTPTPAWGSDGAGGQFFTDNGVELLNRGRSIGSYAKEQITREELTGLMAGGGELEALSHELEAMGGAAEL